MRWRRTGAGLRVPAVPPLVTVAFVAAFALGPTAVGHASPAVRGPVHAGADLATLEARLTAATAKAQQLVDDLEQTRSRDGGLRRAVEDLQAAHDAAQARLDARVREVYIAAGPHAFDGWAELTDPGAGVLAARGQSAGIRVEQDLVDAVAGESDAARALQTEAERFREGLRAQAAAVLSEQDQARELLAQAQQLVQAHQAEAQRSAGLAAEAARIAAARVALDAVSAAVTDALTPVQTDRGRHAAAAAEPVLALLEAAGPGYPPGYSPSGTVLSGTASWYGPGFVGSPTASGRPYDPERLSCAHKTLPLGTVLHVRANSSSTNCLVDDRGPYVGDRILDLSRAASRALGYTGTAEVTAEVLTPGT